jgi:hypothetical protein
MKLTKWEWLNVFAFILAMAAGTYFIILFFSTPLVTANESEPPPTHSECPADAWETFDRLDLTLPVQAGHSWRVQCIGVEAEFPKELPRGQFTVQSWEMPGTFYVYQWEMMTDA